MIRKRKSGSMHLELESPDAKPKSGMAIRRGRICKLLVVDPDAPRCTRIARALPPQHVVLVAHETTMALALCLRERPALVIACADLVVMTLNHFIALLEYASRDAPPPFVALGGSATNDPRVVATLPSTDPGAVRQVVNDLLGDNNPPPSHRA